MLTRPRELTRKQLRELALELDRAGFSETNLATAWREMTNQDIAARIVGFHSASCHWCLTRSESIKHFKKCRLRERGPVLKGSGSKRLLLRPKPTSLLTEPLWMTQNNYSQPKTEDSLDSIASSVENCSKSSIHSINPSGKLLPTASGGCQPLV